MIARRRCLALSLAAVHLLASGAALAQACVDRPNVLQCGPSDRAGPNLYSGVGPYTESVSCAPDANTQALIVSRYGTIAGNGVAWLAYLNAGGRIITEYGVANDVYNEIYGTAYAGGSQFGECADNAMPSRKITLSDAFWIKYGIPPTPTSLEGCGTDDLAALVAGEASVTPLGGLADFPASVTFARRLQGAGTLWLLDADWQDNQNEFTDDSKRFMGALVSACAPGTSSLVAPNPVPVGHPLPLAVLATLVAVFGIAVARTRRAVRSRN